MMGIENRMIGVSIPDGLCEESAYVRKNRFKQGVSLLKCLEDNAQRVSKSIHHRIRQLIRIGFCWKVARRLAIDDGTGDLFYDDVIGD
jgi:hypothetical protein